MGEVPLLGANTVTGVGAGLVNGLRGVRELRLVGVWRLGLAKSNNYSEFQ